MEFRNLRRNDEGAIELGHILVSLVLIVVVVLVIAALLGPIASGINSNYSTLSYTAGGVKTVAGGSCPTVNATCLPVLSGPALALALLIPLLIVVAVIILIMRELGIFAG